MAIFVESFGWIADASSSGKSSRCTLSRAPGSPGRTTRFWYIPSAMYGVKGAVSFASVTRHAWRVAYALFLSSSRPAFQKRARLRRRYQFERASTKSTMRCVAA